jgi:hypothetical protein
LRLGNNFSYLNFRYHTCSHIVFGDQRLRSSKPSCCAHLITVDFEIRDRSSMDTAESSAGLADLACDAMRETTDDSQRASRGASPRNPTHKRPEPPAGAVKAIWHGVRVTTLRANRH